MRHFPIFLDLVGASVVVIGGGEVAARKIRLLAAADAVVTVVAPDLAPELSAQARGGRISHRPKRFEPADLEGAFLCIAATGDRAVNQAAAAAARASNIPVNVVDDPDLCSFIMPAIIDRGRIVVAISSGGASPVLARLIRSRLSLALPETIARLSEIALAARTKVRQVLPDPARRRLFWEDYFDRAWTVPDQLPTPDPVAWLAGLSVPRAAAIIEVAPAEPDLMTLRDLTQIRSADVIFHHRLLSPIVLDQARRDAEFIEIDADGPAVRAQAAEIAASGRPTVLLLPHAY